MLFDRNFRNQHSKFRRDKPEFFMESDSVNTFSKRTSQGIFLLSLVQPGSAVWAEKIFKEIVDGTGRTAQDGWHTTTAHNGHMNTPKSPFVLL